jgi:AraC family transcriptional regulator
MPDETQITRDRYKERVSLALQYIHDNLCESIDLNDVAKASHFSAFHFHRIFHGLMDETLNDYIRRRRLEFAVNMLVYDEGKSAFMRFFVFF